MIAQSLSQKQKKANSERDRLLPGIAKWENHSNIESSSFRQLIQEQAIESEPGMIGVCEIT
jgi:hypothetical protein